MFASPIIREPLLRSTSQPTALPACGVGSDVAVRLLITTGEDAEKHVLHKGKNYIGSCSENCNILLRGPGIADRHLCIHVEESGVFIEELQAHCETVVTNDKDQVLRAGCRVELRNKARIVFGDGFIGILTMTTGNGASTCGTGAKADPKAVVTRMSNPVSVVASTPDKGPFQGVAQPASCQTPSLASEHPSLVDTSVDLNDLTDSRLRLSGNSSAFASPAALSTPFVKTDTPAAASHDVGVSHEPVFRVPMSSIKRLEPVQPILQQQEQPQGSRLEIPIGDMDQEEDSPSSSLFGDILYSQDMRDPVFAEDEEPSNDTLGERTGAGPSTHKRKRELLDESSLSIAASPDPLTSPPATMARGAALAHEDPTSMILDEPHIGTDALNLDPSSLIVPRKLSMSPVNAGASGNQCQDDDTREDSEASSEYVDIVDDDDEDQEEGKTTSELPAFEVHNSSQPGCPLPLLSHDIPAELEPSASPCPLKTGSATPMSSSSSSSSASVSASKKVVPKPVAVAAFCLVGFDDPSTLQNLQQLVPSCGAQLCAEIEKCTHVIFPKKKPLTLSLDLLLTVANGKLLQTDDWLAECAKAGRVLPLSRRYFPYDPDFELKHSCTILDAIEVSRIYPIFSHSAFYVTENVPARADIIRLIRAAKGLVFNDWHELGSTPGQRKPRKFLHLISCDQDRVLCKRIVAHIEGWPKAGCAADGVVHTPNFVYYAILRQQVADIYRLCQF